MGIDTRTDGAFQRNVPASPARTRRRVVSQRSFVPTFALLLAAFAGNACRTGEPSSEPKTPANAPLPPFDRKEPDSPDAKRSPLLRDAG